MSALSLDVQVRSITLMAEDTLSIELRGCDGGALPAFTAGAHVEVQLPVGLLRHYSLMNPPAERMRYVIAVHRHPASRGGSSYLHRVLRVGDVLRIGAPKNNFALEESAPHSLLIAGGIGITPLLAMAHRLNALGRAWTLLYANRNRARAGFIDVLEALHVNGSGTIQLHIDEERQGRVLDMADCIAAAPPGTHFYCCGPGAMLDAFLHAAAAIPSERVHVEYFQVKAPVMKQGEFHVELARSAMRLKVEDGKSVLDTLLDAGVDAPYSCGEGFCGSCMTTVLQGVPDHRDTVLSPAERKRNDRMIICCSRSRSECLVLDL